MRFAVISATLAAALALVAAGVPADPLAAIAAANGHAANVHLRATATRVVEGRTVATRVEILGATRLLERCVAEVCVGTWFDGERGWTYGLNEVPLPEAVDDATRIERTLLAIASYAFAEPSFRAAGGTVVALAPDRWRVRARAGTELVAVVDQATQSIRRIETASGAAVAEYGRPARAGAATFALERRGPFEAGALDGVVAVPGPVGPPAGAAAQFGPDTTLALENDPVPVVPCTLGGRALRCLLDSGATPSAVTLPTAEALGLEPHGEIEIAGLGRFATGFIEAGPLTLGAARFARARFAVIPVGRGIRFDAVVGSDLLGRLRLTLDRARHSARIAPPGGAPAAGTTVGLTFQSGSPMIEATVGSSSSRALLDTGDEAVLSFGLRQYAAGPAWRVVGRGEAIGVAGGDDTLTVEVPDVRIGPLDVGATRATVRRTQPGVHVGIGLWSRYRVDLDEAGERISFSAG